MLVKLIRYWLVPSHNKLLPKPFSKLFREKSATKFYPEMACTCHEMNTANGNAKIAMPDSQFGTLETFIWSIAVNFKFKKLVFKLNEKQAKTCLHKS